MFIGSGSDLAGCVQYANEIEAFNWNADDSDASNIKARVDPLFFYGDQVGHYLRELLPLFRGQDEARHVLSG